MRTAFLPLAAALGLAGLLGPEALPKFDESPTRYAARLWAHGSQVAEDLYVQALLLMPGAAEATVGTKGAGSELKVGGHSDKGRPSPSEAEEKAAALKQAKAENEIEIDAQQKESAKRYAAVKQEVEAQQSEDEVLLPVEDPDEVRKQMPLVDKTGPAMRCGEAITSESTLTTRNIELHAKAIFQQAYGTQFAWKYVITFKNHGQETVQMLTRHWVFVDALGRLSNEVKGPGARGVTPVLPPGGEWVYESGTSLETPHGSMHGSFQFEVLKLAPGSPSSRSFSARVARLALAQDDRPQRVPCIDDAAAELLPLTAVSSTERVILGGQADFTQKKADRYYFSYDIQINNARDTDVEVVGHLWEVVDSKGKRHVVAEGDGVGGVYKSRSRQLAAGDAFRTQGKIFSPTAEANARGTYRVLIRGPNGLETEIEAGTDYMGLSTKKEVTHVPNFVADPNFR